MKAIITVGIPCSGKTHFSDQFCKKNGWININRDSLRFSIFGHKDWSTYKFKGNGEKLITNIQHRMIDECALLARNIIISDTNLHEGRRNSLKAYLESKGYEVEIKDFPVDLVTAYKRDAIRPNGVGREVIYDFYNRWLEYIGRKTYKGNINLDNAVVFDVDGTLAEMHNRGPFDWDKVGHDRIKPEVCTMLDGFREQGYKIVIMTGRDGVAFEKTKAWLEHHDIIFDDIYIRPAGDNRKDSIIKEEMFWKYVAPNYNVKAVVDDRPQVCRMWRELGLQVIQVADPYKEF